MSTNTKQKERPIVLAADAAYAMPLATTLRSITDANRDGWPLSIHIISDDIASATRQRVLDSLPRSSVSIHWHPVDLGPVRGFATADHISKMTYARFLIPEIFPKSVSKVLYLDTDLLALANLEPLWETNLEGAVVGAVLDTLDAKIKGNMAGLEYAPRVGSYFDAGVLLIDVDRWREEGVSSRALEYLARNPCSPYSDQDALNVVCDGRWRSWVRSGTINITSRGE